MSRPLRIQFPGAIYHVLQRGFRRERVFFDDNTKWEYMNYLHEFSIKFNVEIYAFCLMNNHIHLLICTQEANLTRFMHSLNASFANSRKKFRSLDGAVFAGRYKSLLVDSDEWLLHVSAYIHLNPVRARMVEKPSEYKWSSYNDYFKLPDKRRFNLAPENVLSLFSGTYFDQMKEYENYVCSNAGLELPEVYRGVGYGECALTSVMDDYFDNYEINTENYKISKNRNKYDPLEILKCAVILCSNDESMLYSSTRNNMTRQLACYGLRKLTQLKLREIGELLKMKYHSVSDTAREFDKKVRNNDSYSQLWSDFLNELDTKS